MTNDEKYMERCLQLALNGKGHVSPNPMVGAIVVSDGKIIGEGYHRQYGQAHAEVNAINSVKNKSLLKKATIYVSLEPCSHYGKTPPCSQLIIDSQIPRVVVACLDPYPAVSGRGINMLRNAGIEVITGVLEAEALYLNREFITAQTKDRPYIYLKWAQTQDGFIDKSRDSYSELCPTPISNDFTKILVHKIRSEVSAIMIGTNTAVKDNPSLTTRLWYGKNPTRVVLDRQCRIPLQSHIFDESVDTIIFTEKKSYENQIKRVSFEEVAFDDNLLENIFSVLRKKNMSSVLVEGGSQLLQSLINKQLWDEAYIETSDANFGSGVKAPIIEGRIINDQNWKTSRHLHLSLT